MSDLVEFLTARLDEDERMARDASGGTVVGSPGNWRPAPGGDEWEAHRGTDGDEELLVALRPGLSRPPQVMGGYWGAVFNNRQDDCDPDEWSPMPHFLHAARHDPARVLREVAAKRKLIEFAFVYAASVDWERGDGHTAAQIRAGECTDYGSERCTDVLYALAEPYAEHPDYNPAWRYSLPD